MNRVKPSVNGIKRHSTNTPSLLNSIHFVNRVTDRVSGIILNRLKYSKILSLIVINTLNREKCKRNLDVVLFC